MQSKEPFHRGLEWYLLNKIKVIDENEDERVERRGHKVNGPTKALNFWIQDDSNKIFCKIDRFKFTRMARDMVDRGRVDKAIYAIKGTIPQGFRMISVNRIKYIGDMELEGIENEA